MRAFISIIIAVAHVGRAVGLTEEFTSTTTITITPIITETWLTTITASCNASSDGPLSASSFTSHESVTANTSTSRTTSATSDHTTPSLVSSSTEQHPSVKTVGTLTVSGFIVKSSTTSSVAEPTAAEYQEFHPWDNTNEIDGARQHTTDTRNPSTGHHLQHRSPGMSHSLCRTLHSIQRGETCDSISKDNGVPVNQLLMANPALKGKCDELPEGEVICIPYPIVPRSRPDSTGCYQRVPAPQGKQSCDTVAAVAAQHNTTLDELLRLNSGLHLYAYGNCTVLVEQIVISLLSNRNYLVCDYDLVCDYGLICDWGFSHLFNHKRYFDSHTDPIAP
ncbi:hypothetical protein F5B20DRAFT_586791 [Whalleya microplaca]|nr:hypothetical protein F5B20DRAFT_586791 [Whalleya microplaca]